MDEVKSNLKQMGWNDELIEHFVGKGFEGIKTKSSTTLKQGCIEINSIMYKNKVTSDSTTLFSSSK